MNDLQLELAKLLSKNTSLDSDSISLSDFHRWMNENIVKGEQKWEQNSKFIILFEEIPVRHHYKIRYDSSKDLLDQDESVLEQIIELIKSNQ